MKSQSPITNELGSEKSPYLLQHKDNPVAWKAWGEKAFRKAQTENRLIFLSIGYATCHWCHVMEHESFEDQAVANVLNQNFVAVKVDREELPDVDQIYMDALHAMGQRGGWPLTMILTPDLKPVYGGTYFPKAHLIRLLDQIQTLWTSEPQKVHESGNQLTTFLKEQSGIYSGQKSPLGELDEIIDRAGEEFVSDFDSKWGGFGGAPKFPPHMSLGLLLRAAKLTEDPMASAVQAGMAIRTLIAMARGGLYDHIGGGFTRYSVDERWEIPHFEKMLYVNAQLVVNYLEAAQTLAKEMPASESTIQALTAVASDTLEYVLRDMRASGGGFFSAEDADSEGHEGLFYVWTYEELEKLLTPPELKFAEAHLGVSKEGNFEGKNHFSLTSTEEFWGCREHSEFKSIREKLMAVREGRVRPLLDDKQLTSWNALMITALARASRYFDSTKSGTEYLLAAQKCAEFLRATLFGNARLHRRYRAGEVRFLGTLDDYAYTIQALIELYQADFDEKWLLWARDLQKIQDELFWDQSSGGYFYTSLEEKHLLLRKKDFGDGALPSANGVAAANLVALSQYFLEPDLKTKAEKTLACLGGLVEKHPRGYAQALMAALSLRDSQELVIAVPGSIKDFAVGDGKRILSELNRSFRPDLCLAISETRGASAIPLLQDRKCLDGKVTFYLCRDGACEMPTTEFNKVCLDLGF